MLNEEMLRGLCETWEKCCKNENQVISIEINNKGIRLNQREFFETFHQYAIAKSEKITEYERLKRYETWHCGVKIYTSFIEPW